VLVVRLVRPGFVTVLKVRLTGEVPVVMSTGLIAVLFPLDVLLTAGESVTFIDSFTRITTFTARVAGVVVATPHGPVNTAW